MRKQFNTAIIPELIGIVGPARVSTDPTIKNRHAKDKSFNPASSPDVVVWPIKTSEVSRILKLAHKHRMPVTAWGGGTSLQGNPIPLHGGIVLNLTRMNKILEVIPESMQVIVEPGIICEALNEYLKPYNLFLPAFPGSANIATIGGVIANNSGGMYAVKYGVVGDWVMELEVVLASGEIIRVGSKSIKTVSGYNLKNLFIGSSGTLGIITKATFKLLPIPETKMAALIAFPTIASLSKTIMEILHSDIKPAALEHMDENYVALVNKAQQQMKLEKLNTILIELHGQKETLLTQLTLLEQIAKKNNVTSFEKFTTDEECTKLWGCRKGIRLAFYNMAPNTGILSAEAGVPLKFIPDFIKKVKELQKEFDIPMLNHGHVGDGNFHAWALYDLNDKASLERAKAINDKLTHFAISVGGTATGEHGLGIDKKKFLEIEHPTTLSIMKSLKAILDPTGILNPGKIFIEV